MHMRRRDFQSISLILPHPLHPFTRTGCHNCKTRLIEPRHGREWNSGLAGERIKKALCACHKKWVRVSVQVNTKAPVNQELSITRRYVRWQGHQRKWVLLLGPCGGSGIQCPGEKNENKD